MSRATELAAAIGAAAVLGAGLVPLLQPGEAPDTWFEVGWPRDLDESAVLDLLRHLAAARRPQPIVLELRTTRSRLQHLIGVPKPDAERLLHLFRSYLPGVLLERVVRPNANLRRGVQLHLGSRERALRTDAAIEISRSVLSAVAAAPTTTVLQWQLGRRLTPSHVTTDSVGLPTTGRSLSQALNRGLAPLDAAARRDLQDKVGERGFAATLRVATSTPDAASARAVLHTVVSSLRVAEAPGVPLRVRATASRPVDDALPPRRYRTAINVQELIGLLGWPLGDRSYPGVERVRSRRLAVPEALHERERVVGDGNHPGSRRPVALSMRDALTHTHVLGPTGVGKSTLLANLALADIEAGRAVVVVEPKGDLVADILARIPRERLNDVVVLDPADAVAPVGLNPLHDSPPELAADQILAVFRGLYGDYLGPRTTDVLHAALLTLARAKNTTLVALPSLLTEDRLRHKLTAPVRDDIALGPFWSWYDALTDGERQQVIGPVMNKVRPFLLRVRLRHVLGQSKPRFSMRALFTERKILLVPLGKGSLGSEAAGLIGSLVVAQLWQAAQARTSIAPERRHPVSVFIDEFQDFLHLPTDLADVLAQARGLGVGLTLAHQHLAQLSPAVRAAVLANARSRVCFRLSAEDATVIARSTDQLDAADFQQLGRYEAYASLVSDGAAQTFCSISTRALPNATGDAESVRASSRDRHGVEVESIERELRELSRDAANRSSGSIGSRRRERDAGGGSS